MNKIKSLICMYNIDMYINNDFEHKTYVASANTQIENRMCEKPHKM